MSIDNNNDNDSDDDDDDDDNDKQDHMLKRSIFAILSGFLHHHLPYIINDHDHLSGFMQVCNGMTVQVPAFP